MISPQLPAISLEMRAQMKLAFDLLFDAGNKVAEAYGIAMQLPDDLIKMYASRGIDLPTFDGDNSWRLPVPARIVLAKAARCSGSRRTRTIRAGRSRRRRWPCCIRRPDAVVRANTNPAAPPTRQSASRGKAITGGLTLCRLLASLWTGICRAGAEQDRGYRREPSQFRAPRGGMPVSARRRAARCLGRLGAVWDRF